MKAEVAKARVLLREAAKAVETKIQTIDPPTTNVLLREAAKAVET